MVKHIENEMYGWNICLDCKGRGKKSRRLTKKARLHYLIALEQFEKTNSKAKAPVRPKGHLFICLNCGGTGLQKTAKNPLPDQLNYPHVAIIGAGIGGVALAVACLHRGIPFTIYERDKSFNERMQGYGLTLQQASKAMAAFGIPFLEDAVISTRHVVHDTTGKIIAEWGMRKWMPLDATKAAKHTNLHIARQALRLTLLKQLNSFDSVQWGHQLVTFDASEGSGVNLNFEVDGKLIHAKADLLVGADGIRSTVRKVLISGDVSPLRYLNCMVILGICPLAAINAEDISLLDSATVFQTANGHERIYIMPYSKDSVMWQLSFPIAENEAKTLSAQGAYALKKEAQRRAHWHHPVPQILSATQEALISGYPVYDRALLDSKLSASWGNVTLIGDAAHPMSPFKGQGANQALLDALALARSISLYCGPLSHWQQTGIRKSVLTNFEIEMFERSATKVNDSAAAADFLHSENVLNEVDEPRGRKTSQKPS